jgi:hypothetical protein
MVTFHLPCWGLVSRLLFLLRKKEEKSARRVLTENHGGKCGM